jgi:arylsulfatase A-like enzyme
MSFQKNPSTGEKINRGTIAVWEGDYKLIHYLEDNKSLLFDLHKDPDELNNVYDEKPEIAQHLLFLIQKNLDKSAEKIRMESRKEK